MKKENFELSKVGNRLSFKPLNVETEFLNKLYDKENIDYGKYNQNINNSKIKIGLEFEFYSNEETKMSDIISAIASFGKEVVYCPEDFNIQDKDINVWHIEKDRTLKTSPNNGYEIVSPKIDLHEAPFLIKSILSIIKEYGYTDNTCGFHFHISSESNELQKIKPSKLMLFLDENKTLETWKNRTEFNKDLMDIFKQTRLKDFDANFDKISRFYTLVSRSRYKIANHIEVRAMGGEDYEKKSNQILKDFKEFVQSYYIGCNPNIENDKYMELKQEFNKNSEFNKTVTLADVIKESKKKYKDFDELSAFEQEVIIEMQIFEFEDSNLFVPIKVLLDKSKDYINNKLIAEDSVFMQETNQLRL